MPDKIPLSLAGKTQQWKFSQGPATGMTYEHTFNGDGTVSFRDVKDPPKPNVKATTKYASYEVAPGMHLVSYLGDSGYTLTVLVDMNKKKIYSIASNSKEWYPATGELVSSK
jgi:hypothetical protein